MVSNVPKIVRTCSGTKDLHQERGESVIFIAGNLRLFPVKYSSGLRQTHNSCRQCQLGSN